LKNIKTLRIQLSVDMKLKTNKTLTKEPRKKIKIKIIRIKLKNIIFDQIKLKINKTSIKR